MDETDNICLWEVWEIWGWGSTFILINNKGDLLDYIMNIQRWCGFQERLDIITEFGY